MRTTPALLLASLFIFTAVAPVAAQYGGGGMGGQGTHQQSDDDPTEGAPRSGYQPKPMKPLSRADFEAEARAQFAAADLNHDGVVTLAEVQAAHDAKRDAAISARFDEVDANHDGSISREEFMGWQRRMGDPELADRRGPPQDHMVDEASLGGDADGASHRGHRDHGDRVTADFLIMPISANLITEADTNHDGTLTLAKDLAYQDARFDVADTDHDGFLEEDEMRVARDKQKGNWHRQ